MSLPIASASPWPARPTGIHTARRMLLLGVPLALGLMSGWHRIGMVAPKLSPFMAIIYWLPLAFIMWAGQFAGALVLTRALGARAARLPLFPLLVAGSMLGTLLTRPVHAAYQRLFAPLAGKEVRLVSFIPADAADWALLIDGNLLLMLFFVAAVSAYRAIVGPLPWGLVAADQTLPRAPAAAGPQPAIARRLRRIRFEDVIAIRAEDHYLRLLTASDSELLLGRFSDALAELEPLGWMRTHRSHAVRCNALVGVVRKGRGATVRLVGGLVLPVSTAHVGSVSRLAREAGLPEIAEGASRR